MFNFCKITFKRGTDIILETIKHELAALSLNSLRWTTKSKIRCSNLEGVQKKTNLLVWKRYGLCRGLMWDHGRGWGGLKSRLRLDGWLFLLRTSHLYQVINDLIIAFLFSLSVQVYMECSAGHSVILDLSLRCWTLQGKNQKNSFFGTSLRSAGNVTINIHVS